MAGDGLTIAQQSDLIASTLSHYRDVPKFEVALQYQDYYFVDQVFQTDRLVVQDGVRVDFSIVLGDNGSARHSRMYASRTNHDKKDLFRSGTAPWTFADAEAIYERREITMNRGASRVRDAIKKEYFGAYASLLKLIEERAVLAPTNADDDENPMGLGFAFSLFTGTNYDGGFLGTTSYYGDATTTNTVYGINAVTNPLWANLAANRRATFDVTTTDTMRALLIRSNFKTPRNLQQYENQRNMKWKILSSLTDQAAYERLVNAGPDNRNGDLNPFGGSGALTFRGVEWVGLPTLDNDTYSRLYCVNFAQFQPVVHADWWMKQDEPIRDRDQRNVFTVGIDCQYQYQSVNRRKQGFVLFAPIAA